MHLTRRWDRPKSLVVTTAIAAALFFGALAVMAAIAGWSNVGDRLDLGLSFWFAAALGAEVLAFVAYFFAYRSVAAIDNGPKLHVVEVLDLVAVGFGAFLAKGGGTLDSNALRSDRGGEREGEIRVLALDALEHAPLAPAACAAAITLLAQGKRKPGLDFTLPWAVLVPVGAVLAWIGVRHRARFVGRAGWRGKLGDVLEAIAILFRLVREWRAHWPAFAGATVYWAGDVFCLWASLQPLDAAPPFAAVIMAHAVGYVLTRRTLPFAGAGIVEVLMPLTLVAAGAPFAGAIVGVGVYRVFNLWLPLVPAIAALPHLKKRYGGSVAEPTAPA
jgi:hypothetical protein